MLARLAEQRGSVLALERERGTLGIVLIVRTSRTRLDDPGQLQLQPDKPPQDRGSLRRQHLRRSLILSHLLWIPRFAGTAGTRSHVPLTITQRDDSLGAVTQPELPQGGWFAIGSAREGPIGD